MRALILAAINPDNTPHGYNWTMLFPMLMFAVIALVLWALFGRPHQRVPARRLSSRNGAGTEDSSGPPAGGAGASQ